MSRSAPQLVAQPATEDTRDEVVASSLNVQKDRDHLEGRSECSAGGTAPQPLRKPEVLAPAGGWPQLRAAVENGADAVYFGLSSFNARARAANFTPEELEEVLNSSC